MKPGGLMLVLGGPKKGSAEREPKDDSETAYAREAFAALKDDDEQGFVEAFKGAVKACVEKTKSGGYADTEEDDDEDDRSEGY